MPPTDPSFFPLCGSDSNVDIRSIILCASTREKRFTISFASEGA
jgi:hypothetical protein